MAKKKKYSKYAEDVTVPSNPKKSKRERTEEKQALDFANDPKTGKPMRMEKEDYNYAGGGKVSTCGSKRKKKMMAGGMTAPMGGGAPKPPMPAMGSATPAAPAMGETEEQMKARMLKEMMAKKQAAGGAPMGGGAPMPAMKKGGKVKKKKMMGGGMAKKAYKSGGKIRGAGMATKGVRKCKMR